MRLLSGKQARDTVSHIVPSQRDRFFFFFFFLYAAHPLVKR